MKKKLFGIIVILFISIDNYATTLPLDSIKKELISFLNEIEPVLSDSPMKVGDLPNFLIYDRRKKEAIEDGKDGIFVFSSVVSSGFRYHFVLVGQDSFQILNMEDPIDENILKLCCFFFKNKQYYSKEDILFYIENIITTYQKNEKYMDSFNEIIL